MKISIRLVLGLILLTGPLARADREIEVEFRLQPDGSGERTRNQGIKVEDDEVEVYLDGDEREIDVDKFDTEALYKLVTQTIQSFEMVEGEKVRAPYIEVKMEFSGEDREIEVSQRYPIGAMPEVLVTLQEKYLDEVWR